MSIIEELTKNVLDTSFESFDKDVVEQAKNRILDVVGCAIGGANASGCGMIVDLVKRWGGEKESTIMVHGGKAPVQNAAMVNCIMCRSYDFEPVGPYVYDMNIPAHISGTTVPTAIAVAEQNAASGKELITALILGDDLTSRMLAASRYSFDLGWDGTGTVNMFGATAIAGRLMGLDERQMLNAFGIVINQMAGSFQNIYDGVHCFKLLMGLAARAGIVSAEMASKGFTGIKDPLLSKYGYFGLYCKEYDPEILKRDLGKKFFADGTFKPYPACRSTHATIDCALQLVHTHDIEPEDIDKITVHVTAATRDGFVGQPFEIREVPQVDAAFSLQYTVANALLRKSVRLEHFTEKYIRDQKIFDLVRKVEIMGTLPPDEPLAATVAVRMKDGREFSTHVDVPKGDVIYNPLTKDEIKDKFRANVAFSQTVKKEKAEKVLDLIEALEEVHDVAEIIKEIS
jgi:2-methylcitrate dehydratase PrpD